ncbi:MAG: tripartite tricarboxylate transporter TctB family protein [Dehalococcoidia bacterium]|nr:tripartite tricarboxylate transporter TctB family protein [Dehalococcoidia bacterium]
MLRLIFPLVLLVFCVIMLVYSRDYSRDALLFPLVVLIPATGMLLWQTGKEAYSVLIKKAPDDRVDTGAVGEGASGKKYLITIGWLAIFVVLMYLFGITIGMPIFVLLYLKLNRMGWPVSIFVTVLVLGFFYGFFIMFMKIYIYKGLLASIFFGQN